jgi:hypothetical protein
MPRSVAATHTLVYRSGPAGVCVVPVSTVLPVHARSVAATWFTCLRTSRCLCCTSVYSAPSPCPGVWPPHGLPVWTSRCLYCTSVHSAPSPCPGEWPPHGFTCLDQQVSVLYQCPQCSQSMPRSVAATYQIDQLTTTL